MNLCYLRGAAETTSVWDLTRPEAGRTFTSDLICYLKSEESGHPRTPYVCLLAFSLIVSSSYVSVQHRPDKGSR